MNENIFTESNTVVEVCRIAAFELTKMAEYNELLNKLVGGLAVFAGATAIVINLPEISKLLNKKKEIYKSIINVFNALVLIFCSIWGVFIKQVSPKHMKDYSKYLRKHANIIENIASNPTLNHNEKELKLFEACKFAKENLQDAYNNWSAIQKRTKTKLKKLNK